MQSLAPSSSVGSSLGARQRFTQEYLAKQLPVFQERIPRAAQEPPKYPTNAPPNLPLPPLLPGEEILLMQDRVACLDTFSEPAVGSVYITNFRIIFNGNSISDPEGRESILEGLPSRKEHTFSLEAGKLSRNRTTTRPSATFNSYLTNPDQVPTSKWRLNSLRRPPRSTSDNTLPSSSSSVKKSSSLRRPTKDSTADSTDGASAGGMWSDLGSVLNRGARSLRISTGKRKGIVHRDTVQWDSVSSVSSVSELSECPTTGTNEASEYDVDVNTSPVPPPGYPVFTVGSVETSVSSDVLVNGSGPQSLGCVPKMSPDALPTSLDSGVIVDPHSGSWNTTCTSPCGTGQIGGVAGGMGNGHTDEVDFEKYSVAALDPILETEAQRLELESSIDPSLLLDPLLERQRQAHTRKSWFRKTSPAVADEEVESASDEASEEDEKIRTLTEPSSDKGDVAPVGYSKVEILPPNSMKHDSKRSSSPVYSTPVTMTGCGSTPKSQKATTRSADTKQQQQQQQSSHTVSNASEGKQESSPVTSKRKPLPPTPPKKPRGMLSPGCNTGTCNAEVGEGRAARVMASKQEERGGEADEENGELGGRACESGYANFAVLKRGERERSVSNPGPLKKPMPLPRNGKAGTLDRLDSKDRGFGFSLPSDFIKPTPVPRKPTLTSPSSSPQMSRSPRSQKPPVSTKPLLPKPSPPLLRAHPHPPSPPSHHSSPTTTPTTVTTGPLDHQKEDNVDNGQLKEGSPVPPPRRRRKAKTTPTKRKPLSPIYSPPYGSPVKTVAVPSDTGSSDLPDTSSESDHSHPHYKFLPSPSPGPRSPSPFGETSPVEWQDERSQNSSLVAQRHSIPSIRSSIPASPLDPTSTTYGYMGEREPLPPVASPYSTITRAPPGHSLSPLPTSTRYAFSCSLTLFSVHSVKKQPSLLLKEDGIRLPEGVIVHARNFRFMKLHIHPHNKYDADGLKELLEKKVLVEKPPQDLFAFRYCTAIRHPNPNFLHTTALPNFFKLRDEIERLRLSDSQVWHVSLVLKNNPEVTPSYPREVIVPRCIPDLDLLRGARLYRSGRFPTLSWSSRDGSALLRAAPTLTHRGQAAASDDMCLDQAVLQAVCIATEKAGGSTRLYIFTEKPDSTPTALSDPMHTSLTAAQKRAYYYPNCQFEYAVSPPTFKNIRHSFRKLSALLEENKVGEDEFLIALDDTQWLYRVQELLQTAAAVVSKMEEERASVLVSYDYGCDRTTQVISLAQLLLDPYYRTMNGFQILVQKEWVWFGHPFASRHTRRSRLKEDGPVFLQWVDCVWQVMQQCPSAFEFNEKFLMVLVESSYSGQFGTFLLNTEQERHKMLPDEAHKHKSVATHTLSYWTWVGMVNAAGRTFYNNLYDADTFPWVIYPNCTVPCLKLWTSHYSQSRFQDHHSTNTTPLQKQLEQLVREYQRLSGKADVSDLSSHTGSISPSPSTLSDDSSRSTLRPERERERERERVRVSGRSVQSKTPALYPTIEQYLLSEGIDATVCKHAKIAGNTCQGSLVKLGGVRKNWQERWFVLDFASQLLTYFESKEVYTAADKSPPKGVVKLSNISKVWQNSGKREHLVRHVFSVETKTRTYLFRAPTLLTMQLWITLLNMPRSAFQFDT